MPLTSTAALMRDARPGGIVAFNAITLEQAEALLAAADIVGRPVILQVSQGCLQFHGPGARAFLRGLTQLVEDGGADASIHLDHIESPFWLTMGAGTGVSSAMVDASRLPYDDNVALVAQLVEHLHSDGWYVEAELGEIGGKRGAHASGARTDPAEAAAYVASTGVDALAVAVGSSHGMSSTGALLDDELIAAIAGRVDVPLVLHGSSGVGTDGIRRAVSAGITKVNFGTRLAAAYTDALRRSLGDDPAIDPRPHLAVARDAVEAAAIGIMAAFGPRNG